MNGEQREIGLPPREDDDDAGDRALRGAEPGRECPRPGTAPSARLSFGAPAGVEKGRPSRSRARVRPLAATPSSARRAPAGGIGAGRPPKRRPGIACGRVWRRRGSPNSYRVSTCSSRGAAIRSLRQRAGSPCFSKAASTSEIPGSAVSTSRMPRWSPAASGPLRDRRSASATSPGSARSRGGAGGRGSRAREIRPKPAWVENDAPSVSEAPGKGLSPAGITPAARTVAVPLPPPFSARAQPPRPWRARRAAACAGNPSYSAKSTAGRARVG